MRELQATFDTAHTEAERLLGRPLEFGTRSGAAAPSVGDEWLSTSGRAPQLRLYTDTTVARL